MTQEEMALEQECDFLLHRIRFALNSIGVVQRKQLLEHFYKLLTPTKS
jgi:hypothetical protein